MCCILYATLSNIDFNVYVKRCMLNVFVFDFFGIRFLLLLFFLIKINNEKRHSWCWAYWLKIYSWFLLYPSKLRAFEIIISTFEWLYFVFALWSSKKFRENCTIESAVDELRKRLFKNEATPQKVLKYDIINSSLWAETK